MHPKAHSNTELTMQNKTLNSRNTTFEESDYITNIYDGCFTTSKTISFAKGDLIIKQGTLVTHAIFIKEGLVKTIKESRNQRTIFLDITPPQQLLHILSLLNSDVYDCSSIAITATKAVFVEISEFKEMIKTTPQFTEHILKEQNKRAQNIINRLISIQNKQLPGRVADVILYFNNLYNNNISFEFPLSRPELAQFAGTTKESFIRTLTEFKNDKIIIVDGKKITINSMEIIKTLSRLG
jgi:CRP-like cAMP-binding protein